MGCDGGSIPKRSELVKTKKQTADQPSVDPETAASAEWEYCALSRQLLSAPVVSCVLGKLYNKDAIYEYLLDPSSHGDGDQICPHIRKPKV